MASLWRRFVSLVSTKKEEVGALPESSQDSFLVEEEVMAPSLFQAESVQEPVSILEQEVPHWLVDEEALRDEGVLFGLSSAEASAKTDIIHKYFAQLLAPSERKIEEVNERIQELNLFLEQRQNRIDALKLKLTVLEEPLAVVPAYQLLRSGIGLVLAVCMCIGNYALIEQSMSQNHVNSTWIALGVFMAGMFNLFSSISLFHEQERTRVGFRRVLEEMGMPLAASLFVVAQVWETQPWWRATALFGFLLFLFLFAGKLFLGMITVFKQEMTVWQGNRSERIRRATEKEEHEHEIARLTEEIDTIRTQKWQYLNEQGNAEEEKAQLVAKRDMLIKLFESEFNLARNLKMRGIVTDINEI